MIKGPIFLPFWPFNLLSRDGSEFVFRSYNLQCNSRVPCNYIEIVLPSLLSIIIPRSISTKGFRDQASGFRVSGFRV